MNIVSLKARINIMIGWSRTGLG